MTRITEKMMMVQNQLTPLGWEGGSFPFAQLSVSLKFPDIISKIDIILLGNIAKWINSAIYRASIS